MTTKSNQYNIKQSDLRAEWHVIDAQDRTLGHVSSEIATLLQGKHKPEYTPHLACGDFVVVVNADKFRVSGNKLADKKYYRHSGYHGGLTERTLEEMLAKHPTRALRQAVKGMLPRNTQGKHMLSRLKLYAGPDHPHMAQVNAPLKKKAISPDDTSSSEKGAQEGVTSMAVSQTASGDAGSVAMAQDSPSQDETAGHDDAHADSPEPMAQDESDESDEPQEDSPEPMAQDDSGDSDEPQEDSPEPMAQDESDEPQEDSTEPATESNERDRD